MQIRYLNATFGRLEQAELRLQPGLNVIYAPNEAGKSTWSRFIRSMLYGVSTRDRSPLADKNRYAPWSGAVMRGRMDVDVGDDSYTLLRETRRAAAPMGEFTCTYAGTATAVPGITGQNAGEQLLGIGPEVFERSAFISQAGLSVDQDAELERRIAALITTGEEETSFSETQERLKKQLNRRRHNKTGQIPALEREIAQLDQSLDNLHALQEQHRQTARQLERCRAQQKELLAQQEQWRQLEQRQQWEQYREAEAQEARAQAHLDALTELAGPLPDEAALAQMENRCVGLSSSMQDLQRARQTAEIAASSARLAQDTYNNHPLYPADAEGLQSRVDQIALPDVPGLWPFWLQLACAVCALGVTILAAVLHRPPAEWIIPAVLCAVSAAAAVLWHRNRGRILEQRAQREAGRSLLTEQIKEYIPLREKYQKAAGQAAEAEHFYQALRRQQEEGESSLLDSLTPYRAAADLDGAVAVIGELRRQCSAVAAGQQTLREAQLRCSLMRERLPEGAPPDPDVPLPRPAMDPAQLRAAIPQAAASLQALQSRLDTLTGQIRSMGDPDDLVGRRQQRQEQVRRLQAEYDAIALALSALENANLTLQNRFSPALGARAAEIFSGITGGKYRQVLLGRDFSLAAGSEADGAQRSVQLLSQGTTDQLYLSVRLAICDMVLPQDRPVPLIMDDALLSFDDQRLHAALDYLLEESRQRQILLFTCQKREQAYLAGKENVTAVSL